MSNQRSQARGRLILQGALYLTLAVFFYSCSDTGTETTVGGGNQGGNPTPPVISRVVPDSAFVGDVLSIYGTRFTASSGMSSVTIGGIVAMPTFWTDTLIAAPVPQSAANGEVRVTVNGASSNTVSIQLLSGSPPQSPVLTSLSPDSVAVGEAVTLQGNYFGNLQGSSQVLCQNIPATIQSWNDTEITFTAPNWIGVANVVVRVGGRSSNALSLRIYSTAVPPDIISLTPTSGRPGDLVTIDGTGFGSTIGIVTFNTIAAAVSTWTETRITAIVPSSATTGPVVVHTQYGSSNGIQFTVLPNPAPTIISIFPDSGAVGASVSISGSNFGAQQGTSSVTFNGVTASVSSWSDGFITTVVPGGATSGNVIVTVNGQSSNGVWFRVVTSSGSIPTITDVRPNPANVGERVRIHGTDFGPEVPVVTINGVSVALDEWRIDEIRFYVPSNVVTGNLVVTVGGRASAPVWFVINGTVPGGLILNPTTATVTVGGSGTVNISGGTPPYTIQTPPNSSIATATLSGSTITINGVANGSTSLVVQDNTTPTSATATLPITVYTTGSGVSFSQEIQPIFNSNCIGCHGGSGGLFLTAGQSYDNLVNVRAVAGCTTEMRVLPGNAASSVLYKRISGAACGDQMPRGGNPLAAADIQKIVDWINQGALNN
jgi:hypothetical protein